MIPNQPRFTILLYSSFSDDLSALSASTRNDMSTMFPCERYSDRPRTALEAVHSAKEFGSGAS